MTAAYRGLASAFNSVPLAIQSSMALSVGIALLRDHGGSVEQLLHAADRAMYQAKQAGPHPDEPETADTL
jgi:GGDEF domain-containing protein